MKRLSLLGIVLLATLATGCAATTSPVNLATAGTVAPAQPGGVIIGKAALPKPTPPVSCSNPNASLRPPTMPPPGQMPPNSTMGKIQKRGYLIAGVDQNTFLFGYRDPNQNQLVGFDIDMVHDVAQAIFGDPNKVVYKAITSAQRTTVLEGGQGSDQVDMVARTFTITCARLQQVAFSTVYYQASRRVLVPSSSKVTNINDLRGKKVCATTGSDSLTTNQGTADAPIPVAVNDWSDCLVMLQQGEVDAVSTDDTILAGMVAQDGNTKIVGPPIFPEPYGLAFPKANTDFVSFVNGVLEQIRANGSWAASYSTWLKGHLSDTVPAPPSPEYRN